MFEIVKDEKSPTSLGLNVPEISEPEVSEPSSSLYELEATTPCDLVSSSALSSIFELAKKLNTVLLSSIS